MKLGAVFPQTEIGSDPIRIRDYAQAVEEMGFDHILAYDHVVGANLENRPDWSMPYSHESAFHEPLVLFGYLAAVTKTIELATGVLILPQRQAVLVAKQAANVDLFSGGRLRLGFGTGWNAVEYEALGTTFADRGARIEEQVDVIRRLWSGDPITYKGKFHSVSDAGINPAPARRIPIWFGGLAPVAMRRAARLGDGWISACSASEAASTIEQFHSMVREAGRRPEDVGVDNIIFVGTTMGGPIRGWEEAVADCDAWHRAGATAASIHTMSAGLETIDEHLNFLSKVKNAVDEFLKR